MRILIIGQGIAGSVLAFTLRQQGCEVVVCDGSYSGASSPVAAGIINPVTGKRYVKSWGFDTFYPVAKRVYHAFETYYGTKIWYGMDILRLLQGAEELNNWAARCAADGYGDLLSEVAVADDWSQRLSRDFEYGKIHQAARVDFSKLIQVLREDLVQNNAFLPKKLSYDEITELARSFDALVFCEGFRGVENPYFPNLPWRLAKGEVLLLRFDDLDAAGIDTILKRNLTVVPVGDGLFWVGSAYEWHFKDALPTPAERANLLEQLEGMLHPPFTVVDHQAGIRPAVVDRRPFLLRNAQHPNVFMFNGLGAKGALLAPYLADQMAGWILNGREPILPD